MAVNAITSTNSTTPLQPAALRTQAKIQALEAGSAPLKKDTLELSDAALQLKAASDARAGKMDAAVKSARALAKARAHDALQAAKELAESHAKKSQQA